MTPLRANSLLSTRCVVCNIDVGIVHPGKAQLTVAWSKKEMRKTDRRILVEKDDGDDACDRPAVRHNVYKTEIVVDGTCRF